MKYFSLIVTIFFLIGTAFAQEAGTVKWTFKTGDFIFGAPAIGSDGTVYVASNDHYLYAINSNGGEKWKFDLGYGTYGSPAIATDGTIYIGTAGIGKLFAINPDGTKKWESEQADGWIEDSPAIAADGTIVFGTSNQNFYGIKPDGTTRWKIAVNSNQYSSPAIAADGTIYMGFVYGSGLRAFNSDGSKKWNLDIGGVESSPAIGSDGTVYVGSKDKNLYAINPNGTIKWTFSTGSAIYASAAIGANGTIYIGSTDGVFYAVNPDGTEKWRMTTDVFIPFQHSDSPAIGADGTIYVTAMDTAQYTYKRFFYAINANGTVEWRFDADAIQGQIAIADDGTIYLGSQGGTLYALYSNSSGLANSSWPRFHHDNHGTGNVQTSTAIRPIHTQMPQSFTVSQVYPNPFNPSAQIRFSLNKTSRVQINVYNSVGQKVSTLLNAQKASGTYELSWNAASFSSGVYLIDITANGVHQIRKAILIK